MGHVSVPVHVVISVSDGTDVWQVIAGWSSNEWGPFDTASDVVSVVQDALSARWAVMTPDEARLAFRKTTEALRDAPWEQLSLL